MLNTYKTIQKLDKILSIIHDKFIHELENNFLSLQECFNEVFSTIKLDILDILVKEEEIKKEKEKAEILSTELKELNKNLEDKVNERTKELSISKEIAESANKAKNEFLAKISHEMRTPLTPIIGYSRILAKDIDEPSYKEKLEIIHTSGVKLLNFTNELLDFSKIESGKVDLNYEPFNVRALFQDIYHEHIDLAKAKGLDFKIDYLHANVSIYSDKIKIYEIAKNIIHNALKYTNKGFVLCDVFVEKNTLYFNVYDSGIGISEDNIQNIFESFVQIGKEQSGAGLGLSITKKLLKVLNGTIEVESKIGQGSTFKIQIPIETSQKEFENFSDVVSKLLNSNNSGIKTIFLKSILKLPLRIKDLKDAHKKQDIEEVRKINHLIKGTYGNLNLTLVYDISEKISLELKKENVSFDSILHYIEELEYLTHTLDYNELFNTYLQFKERKIKILIAEDAEETRDFLKALLETSLIEVTCVENGLEALNFLKIEKFD
ncbi:ATP-binding protein [Fusobacterium periodonticum]